LSLCTYDIMNKVTILPGCITCGLCESIAPAVFEVTDIAHVKPDAPLKTCASAIRQAVAECPVQVIHVEEKE
jgi:ferredoxin